MNSINIAVGIVLYNPSPIDRFVLCLNSIFKQCKKVYIFDNSSNEIDFQNKDKVVYLRENKNQGISYALNKMMEKAKKDNVDWLITMDQDSIIPDNMIREYKKAIISTNENIGIICPQVVDLRREYMKIKQTPEIEFVDFCITSASCTSIKVWKKIGKFDDYLFIDLVDNDFCKRLISSGYKILRINSLVLNQEFGNIIPKKGVAKKFWLFVSKLFNNQNLAKLSYKKFVNPVRVYYTCRNILYVNKKLQKYGKTGYKENYNCSSYFGFIFCFIIPSFLRSNNKIITLKAIYDGTKEGITTNVKPWKIQK